MTTHASTLKITGAQVTIVNCYRNMCVFALFALARGRIQSYQFTRAGILEYDNYFANVYGRVGYKDPFLSKLLDRGPTMVFVKEQHVVSRKN